MELEARAVPLRTLPSELVRILPHHSFRDFAKGLARVRSVQRPQQYCTASQLIDSPHPSSLPLYCLMLSSASMGFRGGGTGGNAPGQNVPGFMAMARTDMSAEYLSNMHAQTLQWRTFDESSREVRVRWWAARLLLLPRASRPLRLASLLAPLVRAVRAI